MVSGLSWQCEHNHLSGLAWLSPFHVTFHVQYADIECQRSRQDFLYREKRRGMLHYRKPGSLCGMYSPYFAKYLTSKRRLIFRVSDSSPQLFSPVLHDDPMERISHSTARNRPQGLSIGAWVEHENNFV